MEKQCSRCREIKPAEEFHLKDNNGNGRRGAFCKPCNRLYLKEHYQRNKEYYKKKRRRSQRKYLTAMHALIVAYLKEHPCVDCGEADIVVLECDHNDRKAKTACIGRLVAAMRPWSVILAEMEKCSVRCANCHRRKTSKEQGSYRYLAC